MVMQKAIADGYRSRMIDADDSVELLLTIADRLDPPVGESVAPEFACPDCGMTDVDRLVWIDDELFPGAEKFVRCHACVAIFDPTEGGPQWPAARSITGRRSHSKMAGWSALSSNRTAHRTSTAAAWPPTGTWPTSPTSARLTGHHERVVGQPAGRPLHAGRERGGVPQRTGLRHLLPPPLLPGPQLLGRRRIDRVSRPRRLEVHQDLDAPRYSVRAFCPGNPQADTGGSLENR